MERHYPSDVRYQDKSGWNWWVCLPVLAIGLLISSAAFAQENDNRQRQFRVFDGTLYKRKPDLRKYGIEPIDILYVSRFYEPHESRDALPKELRVRKLAREAANTGKIAVIDIEHWSLHGEDDEVSEAVAKYADIADWMHDEEPMLRLGYFGKIPIEDYVRSKAQPGSWTYRRWQVENERVVPLVQAVDVIFPSIYTCLPDEDGWVQSAVHQIAEARRHNKPVYVFLWPQYSDQQFTPVHLRKKYLSPGYWKRQLETAHQYADGIVIWGGWGDSGPDDWDENAEWWQITKDFLRAANATLQ